jgi:LAS superfamily LD-carboxypeptidase LdcB
MRRPFVRLSAQGVCPNAPPASSLAQATPAEGYAGKAIQLRPGALAAYRRLAAAARADPAIAADPRNLTIFSGFRSPAADAERCAREKNCSGVVRASCSAHRTGLAMDLYVGQAPGFGPDSSADPNRRFMSRTPAYRWLVANADRFGFVPYPFEPWHWEWTGEAP